ncbi:hypothetical protein D9758_014279 [Tetrapyrgos nigripes]|uniref:Plasma membrane ammonium transporter n=1 Tax=Tetrapyrgos nigripes TaxID=182062 RepID=A0A8H5C665_9AGAR|nr:hypothetical protein D9758_014279 [Tetrapyrgos nigripes]
MIGRSARICLFVDCDMATTSNSDIEKGSAGHLNETANGSRPPVQLTPEQYEKLFLQPGGRAPQGTFALRFGNPTPLPILGYLLCLTPTACYLMQWGGADSTSMVTLCGPFYFVGGLTMVVGGVMEWILGNTFPFVVFVVFGTFWLALGVTNDPMHNITAAYNSTGGAASVAYNNGVMFYFIFWALTVAIFCVGALRTNLVFVGIFFTLIFTFAFLAAGYGFVANGNLSYANTMLKAAGAWAFANVAIAWYLFSALILASVDMPFSLPVGDLSGFLKRRD